MGEHGPHQFQIAARLYTGQEQFRPLLGARGIGAVKSFKQKILQLRQGARDSKFCLVRSVVSRVNRATNRAATAILTVSAIYNLIGPLMGTDPAQVLGLYFGVVVKSEQWFHWCLCGDSTTEDWIRSPENARIKCRIILDD